MKKLIFSVLILIGLISNSYSQSAVAVRNPAGGTNSQQQSLQSNQTPIYVTNWVPNTIPTSTFTPTITPTPINTPAAGTNTWTPTNTPNVTQTGTTTPTPTNTPLLYFQASYSVASVTPSPVFSAPGVGVYGPIRLLATNSTSVNGFITLILGVKSINIPCPANGVGYDGTFPDTLGNQAVSIIPTNVNGCTIQASLWRRFEFAPTSSLKPQ